MRLTHCAILMGMIIGVLSAPTNRDPTDPDGFSKEFELSLPHNLNMVRADGTVRIMNPSPFNLDDFDPEDLNDLRTDEERQRFWSCLNLLVSNSFVPSCARSFLPSVH